MATSYLLLLTSNQRFLMENSIEVAETPIAEVIIVTPEIAEMYLELNFKNRPLTKSHVSFLAEQMRTGAWQMAYDPIRISVTNVLLDGQHRLRAIVESGTSQQMLVIRGLPDETFTIMDTGRIRTANDVLTIAGITHGRGTAALVRMIINYEQGRINNTMTNMGRIAVLNVTHQDVLDYVRVHNIMPYVAAGLQWYRECRFFTPTEYGFFYYIFSKIDEKAAKTFIDSFVSGAELGAKDPIFVLRKKIETYKINRISTHPTEKLALAIKAWNLFREKKYVGYLTYNKDKEDFPEPI